MVVRSLSPAPSFPTFLEELGRLDATSQFISFYIWLSRGEISHFHSIFTYSHTLFPHSTHADVGRTRLLVNPEHTSSGLESTTDKSSFSDQSAALAPFENSLADREKGRSKVVGFWCLRSPTFPNPFRSRSLDTIKFANHFMYVSCVCACLFVCLCATRIATIICGWILLTHLGFIRVYCLFCCSSFYSK